MTVPQGTVVCVCVIECVGVRVCVCSCACVSVYVHVCVGGMLGGRRPMFHICLCTIHFMYTCIE